MAAICFQKILKQSKVEKFKAEHATTTGGQCSNAHK